MLVDPAKIEADFQQQGYSIRRFEVKFNEMSEAQFRALRLFDGLVTAIKGHKAEKFRLHPLDANPLLALKPGTLKDRVNLRFTDFGVG
jgi:hypothetical protein